MFRFLDGQSAFHVMLLFMVAAVALAWLGAWITRPFARWLRGSEPGWNEVVGAILSCFGVFYGLLLGLLAVAAFQRAETAEGRVAGEASSLAGVYSELRLYPEPLRHELLERLLRYVKVTAEEDWPVQQQGEIPMVGSAEMRKFLAKLHSYDPPNPGREVLHASVVQQCDQMRDLRRHRLYTSTLGLPRLLWVVVGIGGVLNFLLLWLLDVRLRTTFVLVGIVALFLGSVVCVIALLDNPYRGPLAVDPGPYRAVLRLVAPPEPTQPR